MTKQETLAWQPLRASQSSKRQIGRMAGVGQTCLPSCAARLAMSLMVRAAVSSTKPTCRCTLNVNTATCAVLVHGQATRVRLLSEAPCRCLQVPSDERWATGASCATGLITLLRAQSHTAVMSQHQAHHAQVQNGDPVLLNLGDHLLHHPIGSIERESATQPDQHQPCSRGKGSKCGSSVLRTRMHPTHGQLVDEESFSNLCLRQHSDMSAT